MDRRKRLCYNNRNAIAYENKTTNPIPCNCRDLCNFKMCIMKLEEQINQAAPHAFLMEFEVDCLVKVAENFSIGFKNWYWLNAYEYPNSTDKELLEIYKKQL